MDFLGWIVLDIREVVSMKTIYCTIGKITLRRLLLYVGFAVLLGLAAAGCGEPLQPPDKCDVPPGDSIGYMDCGRTSSGERCAAGCGVLPGDGSPGHLLPAGCTVEIGTAAIEPALCVESCGECAAQ